MVATPANVLNICTPVDVGTDCVTANPGFVGFAGFDFRITADSPCWNTGRKAAWMSDALDLWGNPRIDHKFVDIGAYEVPYFARGTHFIVR